MRRITLIASLAAVALAVAGAVGGADGGSLGQERGTLWVTNRGINTLAAYDAATGRLLGTTDVGREPNDVVVPPKTGKAYVTNEADSTISVVSTTSFNVLKTIPVGSRPHHIEATPDGTMVVFGEFGTNKVGMLDTRTDTLREVAASLDPAARTHQAFPSLDGTRVWATNEVTNDVAAIDVASGRLLYTIPVGNRPSEVIVGPDGRTAYVSVRNEDKVRRIDLGERQVTGEVAVGTQPDTLQLALGGRLLVVALRGNPAQISFVDTSSFLRASTVDVAGPGTLAGHDWVSSDGRFTFVAFEGGTPGVATVDNLTGAVLRTDRYPGGGRPHGFYLTETDVS